MSEGLVSRAGSLAEEHAPRGYDAVQLTARPDDSVYRFGSFDGRLHAAATREGLRLANEPDEVRDVPARTLGRRARAERPRVAASGRSR